jgi:serine/threonine-protein kinase
MCDALAHAHSVLDRTGPIIHRAVSPANVLIARDGSVKLDGFGFAKILGGVGTDTTGSSKWTPAYMAPEQVTEKPATPKVDVYAAGLILWELLAGRPSTILPNDPFAIEATLRAVAGRNPESLATVRPDLPKELVAAVDAALVSAPDQRIISCADMALRIRKAVRFDAGKRELRERVIRTLAASDVAVVTPPPPAAPPNGTFVTSGASRAPDSGNVSTTFARFSWLVSRLQAPTPWRRSPWLVAWGGLTLGLALLIVKLISSSAPARSADAAPNAPNAESPVAGPPPPSVDVPSATEPLAASSASAASSAEQPPLADDVSDSLTQRGLGYLTVHSSAQRANVYVNLKPYGRTEDRLTVPCGNRFVSIAVAANRPGEPLWLAPGTMVPIPCGASFETTMNPRPLRPR